jgi:type VI secretion system protein ImpE
MELNAKFGLGNGLQDVYARQVDELRRRPQDPSLRVSVIQLLCVRGEWDRATTQLSTLKEMSDEHQTFVRTYDALIGCERFRERVFSGERRPLLVGEPDPWIAYMLSALSMDGQGQIEGAAELRRRAFAEAPATRFKIDDAVEVDWLADADSRFGPMFEACIAGKYYWVPLHRIKRISVDLPTDLRDLVWVPATLTFASGGEEVAFLPVRYPGSDAAVDDALKLARRTEWVALSGEHYRGIGQHMWTAGEIDFPLLDVRSIARVDN